jgi:hypothetical protein
MRYPLAACTAVVASEALLKFTIAAPLNVRISLSRSSFTEVIVPQEENKAETSFSVKFRGREPIQIFVFAGGCWNCAAGEATGDLGKPEAH